MHTYVVEAVLVYPNGTPITWPSFLMLPTYLNMLSKIDRSSTVAFLTKGDKIVLLYKTNRFTLSQQTTCEMEIEKA